MLHQTLFFFIITSNSALDFLFNSFNSTDVKVFEDARIESSVIRFTHHSNQLSTGRAFYPSTIPFKPNSSSFSTSFVFSDLHRISSGPGLGLAFVLSNSTSPTGAAIPAQYLSLFSNSTVALSLLAIRYYTTRTQEYPDDVVDDNPLGIDLQILNNPKAIVAPAGYYSFSNNGGGGATFVPVIMRNGQNIQAWIDFDGTKSEINVTIAPTDVSRPFRPLINFKDPVISNYVSSAEMFIGFCASKITWVEAHRVLDLSFSDTGRTFREINVTNLSVFFTESAASGSSSLLSAGAIAGILIASVVFLILCFVGIYWFWWRKRKCEILKCWMNLR